MKFIVTIGYKDFEFEDCDTAINFALMAINSQLKTEDEVTMQFIKEVE